MIEMMADRDEAWEESLVDKEEWLNRPVQPPGLLRFRDPFQRMHAATKAGTVGAIFTVLGTMCSLQSVGPTLIGLFIIAFLLLTVPVAGHLLGRATYMSGGSIDGLDGEDALHGVLERQHLPLALDPADHHYSMC